jgi:hypothetical protein
LPSSKQSPPPPAEVPMETAQPRPKRGRPKKVIAEAPLPPARRGRPKKVATEVVVAPVEDAVVAPVVDERVIAEPVVAPPEINPPQPETAVLPAKKKRRRGARRRRRSVLRMPALLAPMDVPEDAPGRVAFFSVSMPEDVKPRVRQLDKGHHMKKSEVSKLFGWSAVGLLCVILAGLFVAGLYLTH